MSGLYDTYQDKREEAFNNWQRNLVIPYSRAYSNAFDSYKSTLDEQKKVDEARRKRNLELAMFALSLCGGSILTTVFGQAALKSAAGEIVLDTICKNEMQKTFKLAGMVADNKTAMFAIGKVWDESGKVLSNKLKDGLAENPGNYPGAVIKNPLTVFLSMEKWLRDVLAKIHATGSEIREMPDGDAKDAILNKLMAAPFFKYAPSRTANESSIQDDIELTFFMKFVTDLDFVQKGTWHLSRKDDVLLKTNRSRSAVNVKPGNEQYPTSKRTGDLRSRVGTFEDVKYNQTGLVVQTRINELHKKRFKKDFFSIDKGFLYDSPDSISKEDISRAYRALELLSSKNIKAMGQLS